MKPINIRNTCINSCHIDIIQDVNTNDITTLLDVGWDEFITKFSLRLLEREDIGITSCTNLIKIKRSIKGK